MADKEQRIDRCWLVGATARLSVCDASRRIFKKSTPTAAVSQQLADFRLPNLHPLATVIAT